MTGCCGTISKCLLILFNTIFWLSGAGILGVGIWFLVDKNINSYFSVIELDTEDEYFKYAAYILIGFGAFVFFVGFCGCCGAIRSSKCLLGLYVFFLVLIIGGEIAAGVLMILYKNRVDNEFESLLKKSISQKYEVSSSLQNAWNFVQVELECCGATGSQDYVNVTTTNMNFPLTCCVITNKDKAIEDPLAALPKNRTECAKGTKEFFHEQGCKDKILELANRYSIILIAVGMAIAGIEIFGIIAAICVCRSVEDDD